MKKLNNYIGWHDYFINIAYLSAMRSKDPNTKVGCCIVNEDNRIVGTGYNGAPITIKDKDIPWHNVEDKIYNKYNFVIHAEINAILNSNNADLKNNSLYVTHFPCNDCAKIIIQKKITTIYFYDNKHYNDDICKVSKILFKMANIKTINLKNKVKIIINN